jgi:guanosine-3',5'-bis(diphosphate) 3'-pyrophosphohydrolase
VTISEGIKIHRSGCPNAHNMMSRYPYRVVSARWNKPNSGVTSVAKIKISGVEDLGMVNRIADIISAHKVIIRNFNYKMDDGMFEGILHIMVPNNDVLHSVMRKIQMLKGILKVTRIDSD